MRDNPEIHTNGSSHGIEHIRFERILSLVFFDIIILISAAVLSLLIKFEFSYSELCLQTDLIHNLLIFSPFYAILGISVFYIFKLYSSLWEFASVEELLRICLACLIVDLAGFSIARLLHIMVPFSVLILNGFIMAGFIALLRLSYRFLRKVSHKNAKTNEHDQPQHKKTTMLIGAGDAADFILREFQNSNFSQNKVVCIIDDDKAKRNKYLHGVRIVGGRNYILNAVSRYNVEEIILTMPSVPNACRKEILEICQETDCKVKMLPGLYQIANENLNINSIRDIEIEDLLGRDIVNVDISDIRNYVEGRVVLVTGGGGSIGSELCRQIAKFNPKTLIIFDIYENNAYDIQLELRKLYPHLDLQVLIGSVRDSERVDMVFDSYHPELVFHAAAHKHVPLMEDSPNEAIKNNVFGTLNVALAADKYNSKRMLLVSTDKAVRPTNIMGASKRICEMIVQTMNSRSNTEYVAVRFGNVLGSNGSVVPLFKKQISSGGPVTVTDKRITRYFMTIPEAVQLILQAGVYANGGEIFVLDMGEPVRIDDLARRMIKLAGYEPDVDIKIEYSGLRPGEKLYEELLLDEEGLTRTDNELIFIGHKVVFDEDKFEQNISELRKLCETDSPDIREKVKSIVKEYNPSSNIH